MSKKMKARDKIQEVSFGVLDTFIDTSLFLLAFWAQSYSLGSGKKDIFDALRDSSEFVRAIRGKSLRNGVYQAAKRDLLMKTDQGWELTERGKNKLREALPKYRSNRPWDGKVYLITYDVPEKQKRERELLRSFLKQLGCGMFQASVWLTLYNPREVLSQFVLEHNLTGMVIVSKIGKDGNLGQEPLKDLVSRVYKLEEINERYKEFLKVFKDDNKLYDTDLLYLSILKDDPQLPFALLPSDWVGGEAYRNWYKRQAAAGRIY